MFSTRIKIDFFTSQTGCSNCLERVIDSFKATTGIQNAERSDKNHLMVDYDEKLVDQRVVEERFLYIAKDVLDRYVHRRFIVRGMDCPSCALKIEKVVNKIEGVSGSAVNFGAGTLDIEYDSFNLADTDLIKRNIERQTGYLVYGSAKELSKSGNLFKNRKFRLLLVVGVVFLGVFLTEHLVLSALAFQESILDFIEICILGVYLFVVLITSHDLLRSVYYSLRAKSFNIDSLMLVAILGAVIIGQFEEAAMVSYLFFAGNVLEEYSLDKMRRTLDDLVMLNPETVELKNGEKVKVEDIEPGVIVVYKPGDIIALDGVVTGGTTTVNESNITGESVPAIKNLGSKVYAGTVNVDGYIEVQVEKKSSESIFAKILKLVEEARTRKAPAEKFAEAFGKYYTPVVFIGAVIVFFFGPFMGLSQYNAFYMAITLLVVSCPCALVIATPVSIVSAIENSARNGVLVKGGVHLEKTSTVDTMFFDKTGTVTQGRPEVEEIITYSERHSRESILKIAAALESLSEHPIAAAIVRNARGREIMFDGLEVANFQTVPGKGVKGVIDGKLHTVGTPSFLAENGYTSSAAFIQEPGAERSIGSNAGQTRVYVGVDSQIIGLISLVDKIRPDGAAALNELQVQGYHLVMLTGDNLDVARKVSAVAGIKEFYASLLPQEKEMKIDEWRQAGHRVAMLGDGVNDTLALVAADAGIAMGGIGSPTTIETADIVLMNDDLHKIPPFMKLSKKTMQTIKQNIAFSLFVIALLLITSLTGWLSLTLGVIGHEGSALLVIINGMRLINFKWSENGIQATMMRDHEHYGHHHDHNNHSGDHVHDGSCRTTTSENIRDNEIT